MLGKPSNLLIILALLVGLLYSEAAHAQATPGCTAGACIISGTRLANADTRDSELLNALLGSLLGVEVDVELVDWQAVADAEVTLGELQVALGAATPEALLTQQITLDELINALDAIDVLNALPALDTLLGALGTLPPNALDVEFALGDLLQIEEGAGSFTEITLNILDLVVGSIQLFNAESVLTTVKPITISGSTLGLTGVGDVVLQARVLEAPVIACGPEGTQFYSAAIRVALDINLVDISEETVLGVVGLNVDATISALSLYVEIARGEGVLQSINALTHAVTVGATPGIAALYLGAFDDATFADNSTPLSASTLGFGTVGSVNLSVVGLLDLDLDIEIKAAAEGGTAAPDTLNFTGPYPQTLATDSGASVADDLVATLLTSLGTGGVQLSASLPPAINDLLNDILGFVLNDLLAPLFANNATLDNLLGDVVDPLLASLGISIGNMEVTVLGVTQSCPALEAEKSHVGDFTAGALGQYTIQITNTGGITTSSPVTVVDTLPASMSLDSYAGTGWTLVNTAGTAVTFVNSNTFGPGEIVPTLVLTVLVDAAAPGQVVNSIAVNTTGNAGGSDSIDTDPTTISGSSDTDGDGVPDDDENPGEETNPCLPNANAGPCDQDGDGLTNAEEEIIGTDPTNPDSDGDDDGGNGELNDGNEVANNTDPLDACDPNPNAAACDNDDDGLSNAEEEDVHNTDPDDPDTDKDGINDGDEVNNEPPSDPLDPCSPNAQAATCDRDDDGLTNEEEEEFGTNPDQPDSDGDGVPDGLDVEPLNPCVPNPDAPACLLGTGFFDNQFYMPIIRTADRVPGDEAR